MIFVYKKWEEICRKLKEKGLQSIPACEVKADSGNYIVLKHDVETDVERAHKIAQIEKNTDTQEAITFRHICLVTVKMLSCFPEFSRWGTRYLIITMCWIPARVIWLRLTVSLKKI